MVQVHPFEYQAGRALDRGQAQRGVVRVVMQVLLQSGRVKIAEAMPDTELLMSELEGFKAEVPTKVEDDLSAWRESSS